MKEEKKEDGGEVKSEFHFQRCPLVKVAQIHRKQIKKKGKQKKKKLFFF